MVISYKRLGSANFYCVTSNKCAEGFDLSKTGESVWALFCVCVVRASRQASRSDVGAYAVGDFNAGGNVAEMSSRPDLRAARLLHQHKGFELSCQNCTICKGFMQGEGSGCAGARFLMEYMCKSLEYVAGHKGFEGSSCQKLLMHC